MASFDCIFSGGSSGGGYTLTVTCDSQFAGTTITCTDGVTTLTSTCPSASPYEVEFEIPNGGTWTVSGTISGSTFTASIDIPDELELHAIPDGSTVTPTDVIQTWLACAGITDKSYTTLNEVLADSTTLLALMSDDNAADYLVRSTTWASGVTANSTAMTDIGANDYCSETLLANSTWRTAICNSTYFENVLNAKVPTMTDYTTPSGEAIYSSEYIISGSTQRAYMAFDKNNSSTWSSSTNTYPQYVGYIFDELVFACRLDFTRRDLAQYSSSTAQIKIQGSVDGSTDWIDVTEEITQMECYTSNVVDTIVFTKNLGWYKGYRVYYISGSNSVLNATTAELQFYGHSETS